MKNKLAPIILIAVTVAVIVGAILLYPKLSELYKPDNLNAAEEVSEGEEKRSLAPDFTVIDADGNELSLSDCIGRPIVLNFWASWCGPCQSEMPHFEEKYRQYGKDVTFMMVNVTSGRETLEAASGFISSSGYTFPVYYDTQSDAANTYEVYSLPTTYFIDADGYVTAHAYGAIDAATLEKGIGMITK